MKRAYIYVALILMAIVALYLWNHRENYSLLRAWLPSRSPEEILQGTGTGESKWRSINDSNLGFKVEMPGNPTRVAVPANTETGTTEPVSMILVKPDDNRSYAVAWQEKPPVARINDLAPDKTLDQARDGALSRTGSTLVSEVRSTPQGFPGRDIVAHNTSGGIIDTRLIYAQPRLYMLIATSPSPSARHEEDVIRFFNSFTIASNNQIPETLPAATP